MKDIFGNVLEVGDIIAFNAPVYKGLSKGVILRFSPKTVRVSYKPYGKQHTTETSVKSSDLVKKMGK